jgi:hypothetical protein
MSPPFWLVLAVLMLVVLAIVYSGLLLGGTLFVALVALYWVSRLWRENAELKKRDAQHISALAAKDRRMAAAGKEHASKASQLNAEITRLDTALTARGATAKQREAEHERLMAQQAEAARLREEGYKARLAEESVTGDESVWMKDVTDANGVPLSREGLTHYLVLALPSSAKAGQIPVRFPSVREEIFCAQSDKHNFKVKIEYTGDVHRVTVTAGISSKDSPVRPYAFETNHPDGAAFISGDAFAGVFRKSRVAAYRDAILTRFLTARALVSVVKDYYISLRHAAHAGVGALRGHTILVQTADDQALTRAVEQFNNK